jgi:cytochrome c biogenesis protein CcmG/thiol:disulfide interchange protein DsbE
LKGLSKLVENKKHKSKSLLYVVIGLWILIFVALGIGIFLFLNGTINLNGVDVVQSAPLANLENGSLANDFELPDVSGSTTRLSDLRGKVVVINFWATWCVPCVQEMPMFDYFASQYPQFTMLGIDPEESPDKVGPFVEKMGMGYKILLDRNSKVMQSYKVSMLPTTFFIDEQGMIRFRHFGSMSQNQLTYYLHTLGVIK